MSAAPTLQTFVDDELLRAPLAFDQVVDAVYEQWRQSLGRQTLDAARQLQNHRREIVAEALRSLRGQIQDDVDHHATTSARVPGVTRPAGLELSLIDEDAVEVDIELSRSIEAIKSQAEVELRELQTYTSALVGDHNVARDTNPFRPETYVRALWQGAQTLPVPRSTQAAFLRDAAAPLARALRLGYSAACSRLAEQGVEPAAFRTIVAAGGLRLPMSDTSVPAADMLHELHARSQAVPSMEPDRRTTAVDAQLVDLLARLFDAIQADRQLSQNSLALVLRLQPTALRQVMQDPTLLDRQDHPVWRFMDRLAHLVDTARPSDQVRSLGFARNLVDHLLSGDRAQDASRFEWALGRLEAFERHGFEQARAAAQPEIAALQHTIDTLSAPLTTSGMPLDITTMDTVPAQLLPAEPSASTLAALQPGDRLRAYLQGDWRALQLMWVHAMGDCWLLQDYGTGRFFAVRPRAVERLAHERLARRLLPRSLVRAAAERVLRSVDTGIPGA